MGTRQHKTKGWVIFAVFCAVLFCMAALRACAAKAAPEGCSLKRVRPAQTACFPLGTTAWRVSDAYGWRTDPITGEETFHRGTDLACSEGTLVLAAMMASSLLPGGARPYGTYLCLSHSGRQETLYAHLHTSSFGRREVQGSAAGDSGETGRSTGAHLHFELLNRASAMMRGALLGLPWLVRLGPLFRDPLLLCGRCICCSG